MRSGRLIRGSVANLEFFIVFVLIFGILSVPIAIVTLVIVLTRGHLTRFSLTDGHRSGFRPGPTERGTMNLIYVCMSTIFACVYVSLHVDIPNPSNAADFRASLDRSKMRLPGFVKRFMAWAYRITEKATVRRVLFMLFNIVAPELVVLVSILELISATDAKRFMRSRGQKGWTTMLAFFADMGGFELEDGTHFRNGREFLEWFDSYYREHGEHVQVDVVKLQEEIDDRSKKDAVIKVVTLLQSTWLFVETMARFIENHAVSELEVTTCAYIFCTLITYVCWLKKPYSVTSHVVLRSGLLHHEKHEGDVAIPRQRPSLRKPEPSYSEASSSRLPSYAEPGSPDLSKEYAPVPILDQAANQLSPSASPKLPRMIYQNARFTPFNRSYQHPDLAWLVACLAAGVVGALVGVIHAAPLWNAQFINTTGQTLWRICCIAQILLPLSVAFIALIERWYTGFPLVVMALLMSWVYCVSRIMLFGLVYLSFWNLPASVYSNVDWSWAYVPHWH